MKSALFLIAFGWFLHIILLESISMVWIDSYNTILDKTGDAEFSKGVAFKYATESIPELLILLASQPNFWRCIDKYNVSDTEIPWFCPNQENIGDFMSGDRVQYFRKI